MCGIFGFSLPVASGVSAARRGVLAATLARLNDERGGHSWGVVGVDANGASTVVKGMGNLGPEAWQVAEHDLVFAHTRYATTGEKTIANAHPFQVGIILGAHNGMVHNHMTLSEKYKRSFAVDSQHLCAHLNEGRSFADIVGYGALEWIEATHPSRIYLSRMRNGDLSVYGIGTPKQCRGVIWSSDEDHLTESLDTAGIKAFEFESKEGLVYFVEGGGYYVTGRRCDLASGGEGKRSRWSWNHHKDRWISAGGWRTESLFADDDDDRDVPRDDEVEAYRQWVAETHGVSLSADDAEADLPDDPDHAAFKRLVTEN